MTQPSVSFNKFGNSVKNSLNGSAVGYAGVIGSATAGTIPWRFNNGHAITSANGQPTNFTTSTQFEIASASKFLTAIAAVQLLTAPEPGAEAQNALVTDIDEPIWLGGLPRDWNIRPDARHITYRDVLTHRSGIAPLGSPGEPGEDYFSLKTYMTQETVPLQPPVPPNRTAYSNAGFDLFRLILPRLAGLVPLQDDLSVPEEGRARGYAAAYERIVRDNVFGPVNVVGPMTQTPPTGPHAFAYNYPGSASGYDWSHWPSPGDVWPNNGTPLVAGAGYWWVSIDQLIPVLESLNRGDGKILSSWQWQYMQGLETPNGYEGLGLGIDSVVDPTNSSYRWVEKNGGDGGGDNTGSGSLSSSVAFFGTLEGTTSTPAPAYYAALFVNSDVSAGAGSQNNWYWCSKCSTMAANKNQGVCPATGAAKRAHTSGGRYVLSSAPKIAGQGDWHQCLGCGALFYGSPLDASKCPLFGGMHLPTGETFILAQTGHGDLQNQADWRWCKNCGVLAFSGGHSSAGVCAHGGPHQFILSGSNYSIKCLVGADTVLLQAFHDSRS